jgi:putative membrane protein
MLVRDHTDANMKAMDLARKMNVTGLPTQPSKTHMSEHDRLAKLSTGSFDAEFAKHMTKDNKEDVTDFTKQSKMKAEDPTVAFASQTLPVLQKHLQAAEALETSSMK